VKEVEYTGRPVWSLQVQIASSWGSGMWGGGGGHVLPGQEKPSEHFFEGVFTRWPLTAGPLHVVSKWRTHNFMV